MHYFIDVDDDDDDVPNIFILHSQKVKILTQIIFIHTPDDISSKE